MVSTPLLDDMRWAEKCEIRGQVGVPSNTVPAAVAERDLPLDTEPVDRSVLAESVCGQPSRCGVVGWAAESLPPARVFALRGHHKKIRRLFGVPA